MPRSRKIVVREDTWTAVLEAFRDLRELQVQLGVKPYNSLVWPKGGGAILNVGKPADFQGGGSGLPADYTFEEFTICVSGSPETRWWPTWESDPS
jgi:hypothetical protein